MIVMRLAIVMLLLLPALAFGQSQARKKTDKVSNDNPARPLQMPPASTEVKEAIDDFERFQRHGAWERASRRSTPSPRTRSFGSSTAKTASSFPSSGNAARLLTGLPPQGQAAYRLFYDAEAQEAARRGRGRQRAEEPRAHLLGLFHHVGRRQRRRPAGRSLLRARSVRSRGRLLAGDLARAPRHGSIARPDLGEGRPGAVPRGAPVRIRAGPDRAGRSLQRREE